MIFCGRFKDIATELSFKAERSRMHSARKKVQVKSCNGVKTLADFVKYLSSDEGKNTLKRNTGDSNDGNEDEIELRLKHLVVFDKNGNLHVILYNEYLLDKLKEEDISHSDGTGIMR